MKQVDHLSNSPDIIVNGVDYTRFLFAGKPVIVYTEAEIEEEFESEEECESEEDLEINPHKTDIF